MKTNLARLLKHLCFPPWKLRRALSLPELEAITQAIRDSEQHHTGEIHFAVENALQWRQLIRGTGPRERAIEVFSSLTIMRVAGTPDDETYLRGESGGARARYFMVTYDPAT